MPAPAIESVSILTLTDREGQLLCRVGDQELNLLHATEDAALVTTVSPLTLIFDADAEKVERITAGQGSLSVDFVRDTGRAARRKKVSRGAAKRSE